MPWYGISAYVCGCMEQMLQQTTHVRSYKPELEQGTCRTCNLQTECRCQARPETVEDILYGLDSLHG